MSSFANKSQPENGPPPWSDATNEQKRGRAETQQQPIVQNGPLTTALPIPIPPQLEPQRLSDEGQSPSTRLGDQGDLSARFHQQQEEALQEEKRLRQARKVEKMLRKQAKQQAKQKAEEKEREASKEPKQRKRARRAAPRKSEPQLSQLNVVALPHVIPNLSKPEFSGALSVFLKEKGLPCTIPGSAERAVVPPNTPEGRSDAMRIDNIVDHVATVPSPQIPLDMLKVTDSPLSARPFTPVATNRTKKSVSFSLPIPIAREEEMDELHSSTSSLPDTIRILEKPISGSFPFASNLAPPPLESIQQYTIPRFEPDSNKR